MSWLESTLERSIASLNLWRPANLEIANAAMAEGKEKKT